MRNIQLSETSENIESINISDPQILESIKALAKVLLAVDYCEAIDTPVIHLNPTSEKLAA